MSNVTRDVATIFGAVQACSNGVSTSSPWISPTILFEWPSCRASTAKAPMRLARMRSRTAGAPAALQVPEDEQAGVECHASFFQLLPDSMHAACDRPSATMTIHDVLPQRCSSSSRATTSST